MEEGLQMDTQMHLVKMSLDITYGEEVKMVVLGMGLQIVMVQVAVADVVKVAKMVLEAQFRLQVETGDAVSLYVLMELFVKYVAAEVAPQLVVSHQPKEQHRLEEVLQQQQLVWWESQIREEAAAAEILRVERAAVDSQLYDM